jgi:hypothetical protein
VLLEEIRSSDRLVRTAGWGDGRSAAAPAPRCAVLTVAGREAG